MTARRIPKRPIRALEWLFGLVFIASQPLLIAKRQPLTGDYWLDYAVILAYLIVTAAAVIGVLDGLPRLIGRKPPLRWAGAVAILAAAAFIYYGWFDSFIASFL